MSSIKYFLYINFSYINKNNDYIINSCMKNFLKRIEFRYTDIILLVVLALSVFILIINSILMLSPVDPGNTVIPLWITSVAFALLFGGFIAYIFLEINIKPIKIDKILFIIICVLAFLGTFAIFVQPRYASVDITVQIDTLLHNKGDIVTVETYIGQQTKFVFFYGWITCFVLLFIGAFILPHRIKSLKILEVLTYLLLGAITISFIYSLYAEMNSYGELFKRLFLIEKDFSHIEQYGIKGFFPHRNTFGIFIEMTIFTSIVCYTFTHKRRYLIYSLICFLLFFFTICKTGLITTIIGLLLFFIWFSILKIKEGNKKGKVLLIVILSFIAVVGAALGVVSIVSEDFRTMLSNVFVNGYTITSRTFIWQNTITILSPAWWLLGRGYGSFNLMLHNANIVSSIDDTASTHSWIFSSLGRGGVLALLFMVIAIFFIFYFIKKQYKEHKYMSIALLAATTAVLLHSFMEDNHYLLFAILTILLIQNRIDEDKKEVKTI